MDTLNQLKDIKQNVPLHDYTFEIFLFISVIIIAAGLFMLYRYLKKEPNIHMQILLNLDYSDSKNTAYKFCEHAKYFITEKNRELYEELYKELEKYKYKPNVDNLSNDEINKIKQFIKGIK